jgi:predicted AlkP superfamily phosphohydrolase/phosphomutase
MAVETRNRKVFIIGVDGGTLDLIQPLAERGDLPTFARLMQESAWGTLRSTIPFVSPVAWASFMTGKNPAKHRVLDFTYVREGSDVRLPVNATVLQSTTLWRRLSQAGKRVGVINVPVTYPPEALNGYLISGFPMPKGVENYTYPASLAAELESHGWKLNDIAGQAHSKQELDTFIQGLYRRQKERVDATLWLMEQYEWDLIMLHMFETDRIQHEIINYWTRWVQGDRDDPLARRYGPELERFFQAVDQEIGRLQAQLDRIAPNSTLIVMSDHGFGPTYKAAHMYNWLLATGLMQLKSSPLIGFKKALSRLSITPVNGYRRVPQAVRRQLRSDKDVTYLEKKEGGAVIKTMAQLLRRAANNTLLGFDDVDWQRTRAYCTGTSGIVHITVNLQGRQPHGSVPPQEYESTRDEIVAALRAWRDPYDGGPVISEIYRREEIYSGPFLEEAADVLAMFRNDSEYVAFTGPYFLSGRVIDPHNYIQPDRANHRMNGMVMIKDQRVLPGQRINAEIIDVAPTVLHLMEMPVPSDMDGRVIEACFSSQWLQDHPPQIVEAEESSQVSEPHNPSDGLTAKEEESLLRMLKDLGYVE